jgi:hypothetical protein
MTVGPAAMTGATGRQSSKVPLVLENLPRSKDAEPAVMLLEGAPVRC